IPGTSWAHNPLSPIPPRGPFFFAPVRQTIRGIPHRDHDRARESRRRVTPYRTQGGNSCVRRYLCQDISISVHTYTLLNLRTEVSTNPAGGNDEGGGSELEGWQRQDADELLSGDGPGRAGSDPGG